MSIINIIDFKLRNFTRIISAFELEKLQNTKREILTDKISFSLQFHNGKPCTLTK